MVNLLAEDAESLLESSSDSMLPQLKPGTISHLEVEARQFPFMCAIATREGNCEKCAW